MAEFEITTTGHEKLTQLLDPKKVELAVIHSVNRMADQARTEASRRIRDVYNIQASALNKNLRISARASSGRFAAVITGKGRGVPLYLFDAKQEGMIIKSLKAGGVKTKLAMLKAGRVRGGAVSVLVMKGGGRKIVRRKPPVFIAQMKSGHIGVFRRIGKDRTPIKERYGPGVYHMLAHRNVTGHLDLFVKAKFPTLFQSELKYRLTGSRT